MIRSLAQQEIVNCDQLDALTQTLGQLPVDTAAIRRQVFRELRPFWHGEEFRLQPARFLLLVAAGMMICAPKAHERDVATFRKRAMERYDYSLVDDEQTSICCLKALEEIADRKPNTFGGGRKEFNEYKQAVNAERVRTRQVSAYRYAV